MESLQSLVKTSGEMISDEVREKGQEVMGSMGDFLEMLRNAVK